REDRQRHQPPEPPFARRLPPQRRKRGRTHMQVPTFVLYVELAAHVVDADAARGERVGIVVDVEPLDVAAARTRSHLPALANDSPVPHEEGAVEVDLPSRHGPPIGEPSRRADISRSTVAPASGSRAAISRCTSGSLARPCASAVGRDATSAPDTTSDVDARK